MELTNLIHNMPTEVISYCQFSASAANQKKTATV